ncbi:MAG: AraC family transcriptional regulator [Clostridia bacterium]
MAKYFTYNDNMIGFNFSKTKQPDPKFFQMHMHDFCEIYYFIGGQGIYKIEGSEYQLKSGDILIMRPTEAHYIDLQKGFDYTRMSIHFNTNTFKSIDNNNDILEPFFNRDVGKFNLYRSTDFSSSTHRYLLDNLITNSENPKIQIYSNLFALLNEIHTAFQNRNSCTSTETLSYDIISYINRHIFEDINLDSVCKRFYISKSHLCRIFKESTGSTVAKYISVKRLLTAKQMIIQGENPTKVAFDTGFKDYSVFYRNFKKQFGTSPSSLE